MEFQNKLKTLKFGVPKQVSTKCYVLDTAPKKKNLFEFLELCGAQNSPTIFFKFLHELVNSKSFQMTYDTIPDRHCE